MSAKIKTALEKAMERVAGIHVSAEEIESENHREAGRALAGRFFSERNFDLEAALAEYGESARKHVTDGVMQSLIGNLHPPSTEAVEQTNKRAMEGIARLKKDTRHVQEIFREMEYLFDYYRQTVKQAYVSLREAFQRRAAETQKLIEQQTGVRVPVNPEASPEFREEWLRTLNRIDQQYANFLNEHKSRLAALE